MTTSDFNNEFINVHFDEILLKYNNPLINSNEMYLKYKQNYLSKSRDNFKIYTELNDQLNQINSLHLKTNTNKIEYKYINKSQRFEIKSNIKKLLINQRILLSHFLHYINSLNNNKTFILEQSFESDFDKRSIKSKGKSKGKFNLFKKLLK